MQRDLGEEAMLGDQTWTGRGKEQKTKMEERQGEGSGIADGRRVLPGNVKPVSRKDRPAGDGRRGRI